MLIIVYRCLKILKSFINSWHVELIDSCQIYLTTRSQFEVCGGGVKFN